MVIEYSEVVLLDAPEDVIVIDIKLNLKIPNGFMAYCKLKPKEMNRRDVCQI